MKRFQFNLEKILELRTYHERQSELKLAEATGRCNSLRREIHECGVRKREVFSERSFTGRDMSSFLFVEHYTRRMTEHAARLQMELEKTEKRRRQMQLEFLEASKKRKILSKLKERKQEMYYREELKAEQKNIDDISSSMYIKQLGEA